MPSFDIVSELNAHEVSNAVDQANREVGTRFDFKGSNANYELKDFVITLHATTAAAARRSRWYQGRWRSTWRASTGAGPSWEAWPGAAASVAPSSRIGWIGVSPWRIDAIGCKAGAAATRRRSRCLAPGVSSLPRSPASPPTRRAIRATPGALDHTGRCRASQPSTRSPTRSGASSWRKWPARGTTSSANGPSTRSAWPSAAAGSTQPSSAPCR